MVSVTFGVFQCHAGKQGALCKHQVLVHSNFGGAFPNMPLVTVTEHHSLAMLALGDKCTAVIFFVQLDTTMNINDSEQNCQ